MWPRKQGDRRRDVHQIENNDPMNNNGININDFVSYMDRKKMICLTLYGQMLPFGNI